MPDPVVLSANERDVLEKLSTRPGHFAMPRTERQLKVTRAVLNALKIRGFVRSVGGGDRWAITTEGLRWLANNPAPPTPKAPENRS
jgi:hypothetical protein